MILSDDQVKTIANQGRALPDAVLAPLVLAAVLGTIRASDPTAHAASKPKIEAETTKPARATRRKANSKTRQRIRMVADFVRRNPGFQIGQIAAALKLSIHQVRYVLRANTREVEMRGGYTDAKYYPRGYVNGAAAPQVST